MQEGFLQSAGNYLASSSQTVIGKGYEKAAQDYSCTSDWCRKGGYHGPGYDSQPQPIYIVENPLAETVFPEGLGPKVGGLAHNELTISQAKKAIKEGNGLLATIAKKLTFSERRQQSQKPSLAEQAREFGMAGSLGCCAFFCYLLEFLHTAFDNNAILGFICLPFRICMCCGACCFYNCFGCKQEVIDAAEEELDDSELSEQEMANLI